MQGTWVRSLVREDSTCQGVGGATKAVCHDWRAAHTPQLEKAAQQRRHSMVSKEGIKREHSSF